MRTEARAVWFTSRRKVEIRNLPVDSPGQGQVLVRTTHSGVSPGTEMLAYRGELDPEMQQDQTIDALGGTFRYPFRYGYSAVGAVERSRASIEEGTQVFAFHPHQDCFTVDASNLVPIHGLPAREATLFPLVETAFQIVLDAGLGPGERAIILGLGPVGALTAVLLERSGVRVVGVDVLPWRREALAGLGHFELHEPDSVFESIETDKDPVPLVIEASGNPDAVRLGLRLLSHEGTLMVASWFGNRDVNLPLGNEFHRRRLTIASSQVSTIPKRLIGEWDKERRRSAVAELLGELPLSVFATHTFSFENASQAYDAIDQRREGLFHAALTYD